MERAELRAAIAKRRQELIVTALRAWYKLRDAAGRLWRPLCPACHGDGVQVHPLDSIERGRIKGKAWKIYPHRVRVRECPTCDGSGRVRRFNARKS